MSHTTSYPYIVSVYLELEDVSRARSTVGVGIILRDVNALNRAAHATHPCFHCVNL